MGGWIDGWMTEENVHNKTQEENTFGTPWHKPIQITLAEIKWSGIVLYKKCYVKKTKIVKKIIIFYM